MNIEKLIERLRTESLYKDKATLEIMDLCMEAADALSTLQAENEKLWTGLKSNVDLVFRQAKELDRRHLLLQEQEAELEQVKREKDAAVECCRGYCESCAFERDCAKHDMNDAAPTRWYYGDCEDWEWRGPEEG